jgi:hypothetical protein
MNVFLLAQDNVTTMAKLPSIQSEVSPGEIITLGCAFSPHAAVHIVSFCGLYTERQLQNFLLPKLAFTTFADLQLLK